METRIIRGPRVRLISRQTIDDAELAAFLTDEGVDRWETDTDVAAEKIVEQAGRVCYMSYAKPRPGGNRAYIRHLLAVGHGSVLEHAVFGFMISGVSRSFTHELVRHRAGFGFSQLSQRFVDEANAAFVEPAAIACDPDLHAIWLDAVGRSRAAYNELYLRLAIKADGVEKSTLRTRKAAREAARSVLPNATETKIYVTANARALRHFIEMRGSPDADAEIRRVALRMLEILKVEASNIFGDYATVHEGGVDSIVTGFRKV